MEKSKDLGIEERPKGIKQQAVGKGKVHSP